MNSIFCPVCNQQHNASIEESYCHNCKEVFGCDGVKLEIGDKVEIDIPREIIDDRSIHPGECDACYIHTAIMHATKYSRSEIDVDYDGINFTDGEFFKVSPELYQWQFEAVSNYREHDTSKTPEITVVFDNYNMLAYIKGEQI